VPQPGPRELQILVEHIAERIGLAMEKQGLVERDIENAWLAEEGEGGPLDDLLGHSITYRLAVGPRAGQKLFTLQTVPARSPEPLDFMARLAALVPPPRMHLTRYHGVFAPHSKLRAAAEACVWHRDRGLCPLRREAPDHRQHRGAAGDREDPRVPGAVAGPPALGSKKRGAWGLTGEPVGQGRCVPGIQGHDGLRLPARPQLAGFGLAAAGSVPTSGPFGELGCAQGAL
jgi:hypothetical protein